MAEATEKTTEAQKCSVEGCKRPYRAKGYCVTHYKLCSKEACKKPAGRYGLCEEHRGGAPKEEAAPTAS